MAKKLTGIGESINLGYNLWPPGGDLGSPLGNVFLGNGSVQYPPSSWEPIQTPSFSHLSQRGGTWGCRIPSRGVATPSPDQNSCECQKPTWWCGVGVRGNKGQEKEVGRFAGSPFGEFTKGSFKSSLVHFTSPRVGIDCNPIPIIFPFGESSYSPRTLFPASNFNTTNNKAEGC